ncbi:hypothetical protein ABI_43990 [Asticcacaulis biprosthecium C19]|uniref:Uncharacterized protein n=1 Tax=Asticcacaulis biprosthecium C19 TaxID=715226 RepID=F4QTA2_9CAUL|nr:hypothetical protein ABI_43990 [Asticcacaulis biprosthecium C19]
MHKVRTSNHAVFTGLSVSLFAALMAYTLASSQSSFEAHAATLGMGCTRVIYDFLPIGPIRP